jgi:hypothetical protein
MGITMGTRVVKETFCDKCGRAPDGNSPDSISFIICPKHHICNECAASAHRHGKGPCPVCAKEQEQERMTAKTKAMLLYGTAPDEDRPYEYIGQTPAGEWIVKEKSTGITKPASQMHPEMEQNPVRVDTVAGGPYKPSS